MAGDTRWLAGLSLNEDLIASIALGRRRVVRGGLAGVEEVVVAQASKAALHSETGAAAVDMESHIAAAYAAEADLPFAALRVISDPADRALPALRAQGDQAERRHRPAQDPARRGAQSAHPARAGLDRNRFQSRAAEPARLSRLPARRRGPRSRGDLTHSAQKQGGPIA